jgi:hypothetical protein
MNCNWSLWRPDLEHSKDKSMKNPIGMTAPVARIAWAACLPLLAAPPASALLWGVKTHDPVTGPPATLFWLDEATSAWGQVGPVTVGGVQVDTDGLAPDGSGQLFAWHCQAGGSTLLRLDEATAIGTPVGGPLAGRNIRGATFTLSGRLLAFDDTASELLEIDPATGLVVGDPVPLAGMAPGGAGQAGDLAQDLDGHLLFATGSRVFRLDRNTGQLTLLFEDTQDLGDGFPPWNAGLALSPQAPSDRALYLYEVSQHDGLYRYASSSVFTRTLIIPHVVPTYNAGRGDLAALPSARTEITSIRVEEGLAVLEAFCREEIWVAVEYTPVLDPPTWSEVAGTLVQVPQNPEGIATFIAWDALPAPGDQGFWRLTSSLEDPQ